MNCSSSSENVIHLGRAFFESPSLCSKRFRSIGLSAGLKHIFRFLNAQKLGRAQKSARRGREGRKGNAFPFLASPLLPPSRSFHQCCARPNFRAAKKQKNASNGNDCYAGYESPGTLRVDFSYNIKCKQYIVNKEVSKHETLL